MKQYSLVELREDIPHRSLTAGMIGTIVEVYSDPTEGYEVEFAAPDGRTIALIALEPEQIRPISDQRE